MMGFKMIMANIALVRFIDHILFRVHESCVLQE